MPLLRPPHERLAIALVLWVIVSIGCEAPPHRAVFGDLATADRIELRTNMLYVVTDRSKIQVAATFFDRYRDGWKTIPSGGGAPLFITFLKDGADIGTIGVGGGFLSMGSSTRYPPEAEITALVRGLGVPWPRS